MIAKPGIVLAAIVVAGCARQPSTPETPLGRAAAYLWSQQSADGGWHSRTYGLLRSGQSLTPFVLDALLQIPQEVYPAQHSRTERAVSFIARNTRADGALGLGDSIPDYPNYSTALAVIAVCRARRLGWDTQARRMNLRTQQFTEQNGWTREHPAYGAWGMGGERRTPPDTGHVDLSMTRYALQALRTAGTPVTDPLFEKAAVFVARCQVLLGHHFDSEDGGFFFSTTEADTNKAGMDGAHFRSYGTTTADGILAMLAIGWSKSNDAAMRVGLAEQWMRRHHRDMAVPGFVGETYQRWPQGLGFYYAAASTEAFRALGVNAGSSVADALKRTQRADGSWANAENLVKEDDPLIATGFAVRALIGK
jgi:hypothetical protein